MYHLNVQRVRRVALCREPSTAVCNNPKAAPFHPRYAAVLVHRALHWSGQADLDPKAYMVMCLGQGHRGLPPALLQGQQGSLAGLRERLSLKSAGPVSQQLGDVHRSAVAACSKEDASS